MRRVMNGRLVMAAGLSMGLAGGTASAQESDAPLLRGPEVSERDTPGVVGAYVDGGGADRMMVNRRPIPLPVYFEALRSLNGEDAEEELRLGETQIAGIRSELRRFREDLGVFLEGHGEEIRGLVQSLPRNERREAAGQVGALDRLEQTLDRIERAGGLGQSFRGQTREGRARETASETAERQEAFRLRLRQRGTEPRRDLDESMTMKGDGDVRERLLELRGRAPSEGALQTRIWELLDEPQREHLGALLEARQAEDRARREQARLERDIERRETAKQQAARDAPLDVRRATDFGPEAAGRILKALESGEIPAGVWERLPDRLRQRLESLPQGERAAALRRLLEGRLRQDRPTDRPGG